MGKTIRNKLSINPTIQQSAEHHSCTKVYICMNRSYFMVAHFSKIIIRSNPNNGQLIILTLELEFIHVQQDQC